jgi:predicted transcriptional regulator
MLKLERKAIGAYATMLKALSNETRLSILYSLYERPKTWTELLFELKINPKSLRDHLNYLKKSRLVKKKKPVGFEITTAGKAVMKLSIKDIVSTVEKAIEITKKQS